MWPSSAWWSRSPTLALMDEDEVKAPPAPPPPRGRLGCGRLLGAGAADMQRERRSDARAAAPSPASMYGLTVRTVGSSHLSLLAAAAPNGAPRERSVYTERKTRPVVPPLPLAPPRALTAAPPAPARSPPQARSWRWSPGGWRRRGRACRCCAASPSATLRRRRWTRRTRPRSWRARRRTWRTTWCARDVRS